MFFFTLVSAFEGRKEVQKVKEECRYQSRKRKFQDQKIGGALVFADFAEGDGAGFVAAGLLDVTCFVFGWCISFWMVSFWRDCWRGGREQGVPVPEVGRGAFVFTPLPPMLFPPVLGRAARDVRGAIAAM